MVKVHSQIQHTLMKYMLDKNIFTRKYRDNEDRRVDLCITQDILDESGFTREDIKKIKESGLRVLYFSKIHYEKLKEVLEETGGNINLLNLFLGEGTADIMMIAYILAEKENDNSWFPEEYTIVTNDAGLTEVAASYGISTLKSI